MAGSTTTLRVAGYEDGTEGDGSPAEIDANVKIRWVDDLLVNMSEYSTDLLKYLGGPSSFAFNQSKVEWVEDDVWNRRPALGTTPLANGTGTAFNVGTGTAHRYPIGTIFYNPAPNGNASAAEYIRVTAVTDANTLAVTRDIVGGVATEEPWAATDEVLVAGFSMDENDAWVARPNAIFNLPYNYAQVQHVAMDVTYRRMETSLYGLRGTDLDKISADTVAQQFVASEQGATHGSRWSGSTTVPGMFGGLKFYVTSANGAQVTDLSGAAITRKDIDDKLQALYYAVGGDKMAKTIITSAWGQRKITGFFSSAERLPPGATGAGISVQRLMTDFGPVDILLHTALQKDEMYFIRQENNKIGHYGQRGRPHLEEAITQATSPGTSGGTGPFMRRVFYADLSMMCKGVQSEGRIHNFSTSA